MRRVSSFLLALALATAVPSLARAQRAPGPFDSGVILSGAWLQANALPLDRDAMQSGSAAIAFRQRGWSLEAGWLRIARDLSTVEGGTLSLGRVLNWRAVEIIPTVGILGGKAYASRDSTGYDWVDAQGGRGHTARYSYSDGATFGGGIGLTAEVPIYRVLGARATFSQWFFSGSPLAGDRGRPVLGAGLVLHVWGGR